MQSPTSFSFLRGRLRHWLGNLPSQCAICRSWPARPVCEACVARFAAPRHRCRTCALPLPQSATHCGECLRHPPPLDLCIACCDYAWPWSERIAEFKFRDETGWAAPLATLMRSTPWAEPLLDEADHVLPMPLAHARLRERGFNQAHELARRLAPAKADATLLLRVHNTPPQAGLPRAKRLQNLRGAFALDPLRAHAVQGKRIVLVDDVMTSGASLFTAAQTLRAAGAAHVAAMVLARTPRPENSK